MKRRAKSLLRIMILLRINDNPLFKIISVHLCARGSFRGAKTALVRPLTEIHLS